MYPHYRDRVYTPSGDRRFTSLFGFSEYLAGTLEHLLNEDLPEEGRRVEVADIQFSFRDRDLILLLRERGEAINNGMLVQAKELDKEIEKVKEEQHGEIDLPVDAYITFYTEDGYLRALNTCSGKGKEPLMWGEEVLEFEPAPEPSCILWEN